MSRWLSWFMRLVRWWHGNELFDQWLDELDRGRVPFDDIRGMRRAWTRAKARESGLMRPRNPGIRRR